MCGGLTLAINSAPTSRSLALPLQWDGGEKQKKKSVKKLTG